MTVEDIVDLWLERHEDLDAMNYFIAHMAGSGAASTKKRWSEQYQESLVYYIYGSKPEHFQAVHRPYGLIVIEGLVSEELYQTALTLSASPNYSLVRVIS